MRRRISFLLSISVCISLSIPAFAISSPTSNASSAIDVEIYDEYPSEAKKEAIITSLQHAENLKRELGLSEVSFSEIFVGSALYIYDYTNEGFEESNVAFPLFFNGKLVALAYETSGVHFQISTFLAREIEEANISHASVVYDCESCYLYDGTNFILLHDTSMEIQPRIDLPIDSARSAVDTSGVKTCDLAVMQPLEYDAVPAPYASTFTIG